MTQKEVETLKKSFLDSIEAYVNARLQNLDFVKTQIGVVTDVTLDEDDGKYYHTVTCNITSATSGVTYENIVSLDNTQYGVNSIVFLLAPNAQFTNQFILGGLDPLPSQTINYADLQGKPSINGVTLLGNKTTADLGITATIAYGTTVPTGGSNGDVYFQNDGTNVIAIWQKVGGVWIDLTGNSSSIAYGVNDPTGGSDGDTYIQVAPPYPNVTTQYANATTWVFDGFSNHNTTLTMHGTNTNQWEYIYFYLNGVTANTEYTILFDAKFADNTSFINGGWVLGMCVNSTLSPVNYESQLTTQTYVPFARDSQTHTYSLTFTATTNPMWLWIQFTDILDGTSSSLVINNFVVTTSGEREGVKALWINNSGTWQKGEFNNVEIFEGSTPNTDGTSGLVPVPLKTDIGKYLSSDGTWKEINHNGDGGTYTDVVLYEGTTITSTVTLTDSFENYDALEFITGFVYNSRTYTLSNIILKSDLHNSLTNQDWITMGYSPNSYCFGQVTANNTFSQCYGTGYLYKIRRAYEVFGK